MNKAKYIEYKTHSCITYLWRFDAWLDMGFNGKFDKIIELPIQHKWVIYNHIIDFTRPNWAFETLYLN